MLRIIIPLSEGFDEGKDEFVVADRLIVDLEHSLVSLAKWEAKWEKPFLDSKQTEEQTLDYVRMMIIGDPPSDEDFSHITSVNFDEINQYINAKMTATWFNEKQLPKRKGEIITAEVIYYWMISLNIPFECQYWHLNRLLTLIKVCNVKNMPKKKMTRAEVMALQREINAQRRQQFGSRG